MVKRKKQDLEKENLEKIGFGLVIGLIAGLLLEEILQGLIIGCFAGIAFVWMNNYLKNKK